MRRLLAALVAALLLSAPLPAYAADGDTIGGRLSVTPDWVQVDNLGTLTADVTVTVSQRKVDPPAVTLVTGQSYTWTFDRPLRCGTSVTATWSAGAGLNGLTLGVTLPPCPHKVRASARGR